MNAGRKVREWPWEAGAFVVSINTELIQSMRQPWYSVRCLFHHPSRKNDGEAYLYEERTTIWKAASFDEAHRLAEEEARKYAEEANCVFIGSADSFHLFDESISEGVEIFSVMRGSNFDPDAYKDTF